LLVITDSPLAVAPAGNDRDSACIAGHTAQPIGIVALSPSR
jgi:hypothetical protein